MSNGYCLELSRWSDGEVHLTFWDSEHGQDVNFVIRDDRTTWRETTGVDIDGDPVLDENPTLTPVDLERELLALCKRLYGE